MGVSPQEHAAPVKARRVEGRGPQLFRHLPAQREGSSGNVPVVTSGLVSGE